jgi:hypothetical protein
MRIIVGVQIFHADISSFTWPVLTTPDLKQGQQIHAVTRRLTSFLGLIQ